MEVVEFEHQGMTIRAHFRAPRRPSSRRPHHVWRRCLPGPGWAQDLCLDNGMAALVMDGPAQRTRSHGLRSRSAPRSRRSTISQAPSRWRPDRGLRHQPGRVLGHAAGRTAPASSRPSWCGPLRLCG
jgi:hypothetical protein